MFYVYLSYETQKDFNRFYIGYRKCPKHHSPITDPYLGSYTDDTFEPTGKYIIQVFLDQEEARNYEKYLQIKHNVLNNPRFVNRCIHTGTKFYISKHTEETKNKISLSHKGKTLSESHKQKLSDAHRGKKVSDKTLLKYKNRVFTEETRKKMSESHRGVKKSEIHRKNISISKMGDKNPMKCKKYSFKNPLEGLYEENVCIKDLINKYPHLKTSGVRIIAKGIKDKYKNWELVISSQDEH